MRKCIECGISKELKSFYQNKKLKDGLDVKCRICVRIAARARGYKGPLRLKKNDASKIKQSEGNPRWKGDKAGYYAMHYWVKARLKKPRRCPSCKKVPKNLTGLDLANISQEYKRDITDWEWLCRLCHMKKDGRLAKLISMGRRHKAK